MATIQKRQTKKGTSYRVLIRHKDYVEKIINTMEYQDRKHLRDILLVVNKDGISKENQGKNL